MKRPTLILFLIFFLFFAISAEELTFADICRHFSEYENTKGDFTQIKTSAITKKSLKSSGKFLLTKEGIIWETEKPAASTVVIGKTFMVLQDAKGKKTERNFSGSDLFTQISSAAVSLFAGNSSEIEKNFNVKFTSSGEKWEALFTPKDQTIASAVTSVNVKGTFVKNSVSVFMVEVTQSSTGSFVYIFEHQKHPKELSADERNRFQNK